MLASNPPLAALVALRPLREPQSAAAQLRRLAVLRIHPVHDHVNVRVLRVAMRHDQRLAVLQAERLEAPGDGPAHLLAARRKRGVGRK